MNLCPRGGAQIKVIHFTGNGEPLTNPRLPEMIRLLKDDGISTRFEVTTNASLLTHEMTNALIDAGMTRLLVSIQGVSQEIYKRVCGFAMDMNFLLDRLRYFYKHRRLCQVYIKTIDIALNSSAEEDRFYQMFGPVCDTIFIENMQKACGDVDYTQIKSANYAFKTRSGLSIRKQVCCDTLFMEMNIHSIGDVDCCGCKYPPHFIGNIFEKPLKDIWNGKEHRELMAMHLKGKRWDVPDCATCDSIEHYNGFPEDNLDNHLPEILARLEKMK